MDIWNKIILTKNRGEVKKLNKKIIKAKPALTGWY